MQKAVVKYLIVIFFLFIYINRCLFVFADEIKNQGGGETNSLIEWVLELVTGKSNDIDEDGDTQTYCSFTQTTVHDFPLQLAQIHIFSKEIKGNKLPNNENFLINDFYSQIDHPPEKI